MMKNYDPRIAAQMLVRANTKHGLSRHDEPELARTVVVSVGTEKTHVNVLTVFAKHLVDSKGKHLKNATLQEAIHYLELIAETKKQSTVNAARQAIKLHLFPSEELPRVNSKVPTKPKNRAYSEAQLILLAQQADPEMRLSLSACADAGLRGMELESLGDSLSLKEKLRPWHGGRFAGREDDKLFCVHGKGGLIRKVCLTPELASEIHAQALENPTVVSHRGAHLKSFFDLLGGHEFSQKFGRLSRRVLGFSHGAHGLRHTFAQRRHDALMCFGYSYELALRILSQELGHFSVRNTMAYLRDRARVA